MPSQPPFPPKAVTAADRLQPRCSSGTVKLRCFMFMKYNFK
jgi:hypothetical protein